MARENTRVYVVTDALDRSRQRLVRATRPSSARSHVAADRFDVDVASQDDLIRLLPGGTPVEDAGDVAEPAEPPAEIPKEHRDLIDKANSYIAQQM
jgi:hypothetical protein